MCIRDRLEPANASARIAALLRSNTTFLATRMGNSEQEAAFCFHEQGATAHALKRGQLENNAGVYWTKSDRGLSRDEGTLSPLLVFRPSLIFRPSRPGQTRD